jgi:hypothetical protein
MSLELLELKMGSAFHSRSIEDSSFFWYAQNPVPTLDFFSLQSEKHDDFELSDLHWFDFL